MSPPISVRELPLFPLPELVLFPGRMLPLNIFEYRYRMLMNTILESDKRFGVLLFDPETQQPSRVGCCVEVLQHQRFPDDRMAVLTMGQQRFRVLEWAREKPYRVGLVEWIEDEPTQEDLRPRAVNVERLFREVVHLYAKLSGQEVVMPDSLPTQPVELSYWVASNINGDYQEQQGLLELQNTIERLDRELEILTATRNAFAARTALKDAFSEFEQQQDL
jgi:ATP-dependent Lon protease